jgi:HEAT repeat protein
VGADQTQEVREAAIEALTDVDAKVALPVLKALTTDPNEEIRDAAKDAIELLDVTGPTS